MQVEADLHNELLREGVPGVQHVVQSPLDRVVHGVQLIGGHVAVLEALQPPQQDGQHSGHGEAELDVVTSCHREIQTQKGSNERLFILTRTHSMHIFGEIPLVKPQNDTETTDKRLKTM